MQTQFQIDSYINAYTNETHSKANLQDLIPTLAAIIIGNTNQPNLFHTMVSWLLTHQYMFHKSAS